MGSVWSSGIWHVKAGREAQFADTWRAFAEWSATTFGSPQAWLLRDRARPGELISIGPWPSDEVIARWRADPGFTARVAKLRELVDSFEPKTLDEVVAIGKSD